MSTDLTRVYQFLAAQGDWQAAADTEKADGIITKNEFRTFMEENFENWNGESVEGGLNDLINAFWKKIDTKQAGSIKGTNYKNLNALDSNEIDKMNQKIALYEILNDFTATISAPSVVSDSAAWKKSVSDGLSALVEKYTGTADELPAYLEEQSPIIENKATADYCANEYLNSELADIVKEYGYAYGSDSTLKGIIDSYVKNIPEGSDEYTIQETVMNIIDAYLATAGIKEDNGYDLSLYGYSTGANSALNDLQKCILQKDLENALAEGELKEDYENNKELFSSAIETYMSGLKFVDFESVSADVLAAFKNSDSFKNVQNTIQTNELFGSDELSNAISAKISEEFAERVSGLLKGEIPAYDKIKEEISAQVQNGDFNNDDGTLNVDKVIEAIVSKMQENLTDFYPNGFGSMSIETLNNTYDALVKAARENNDAKAYKNAAISYCKAVASKSNSLAEAVKTVFGDNYASTINDLTTAEIEDKITELKAKVLELGNPKDLTLNDSTWSNLPAGNIAISPNSTKTFVLAPTFTDKNGNAKAITSDRITYKSSNTALLDVDSNGKVTVNGTTNGTFTANVTILVDGVEVGEKTVTVKVVTSSVDWAGMTGVNVNGFIAMDGGDTTPNTVKSLAELYNGNGVLNLLAHNDMRRGLDWKGAVAEAKTAIGTFVDTIASACSASGIQYDQAALYTAKEKVIALYTAAFDHSLSNWAGKKKTRNNTFQYDGQTYSYQVAKYWSNNSTMDTAYSQGCTASNNQLGLRISEQYDDHWFQITVNTKCVMDLFSRFYQQALGL